MTVFEKLSNNGIYLTHKDMESGGATSTSRGTNKDYF